MSQDSCIEALSEAENLSPLLSGALHGLQLPCHLSVARVDGCLRSLLTRVHIPPSTRQDSRSDSEDGEAEGLRLQHEPPGALRLPTK